MDFDDTLCSFAGWLLIKKGQSWENIHHSEFSSNTSNQKKFVNCMKVTYLCATEINRVYETFLLNHSDPETKKKLP